MIAESADFVAIAPYAPRFPFETWLLPKRHRSRFEDTTPGEFASLARMLKDTSAADERDAADAAV